MFFILIILFLAFLAWHFYEIQLKRKHLPPGPFPLPIIGNLNIIYQQGFKNISSYLLKNFGDISTLWVGQKPFITFNNFDDIQETFVKNGDAFAGRPKSQEIDKLFRGGLNGIIITDGPIWREHRRFALHTLRNFGLGRNLMQERVLNEVSWMFDEIKQKLKNAENEMNIQNCIDLAVGSIINSIIFGYSFHEKSLDEFDKVKSYLQGFLKMIGNPAFRILSTDTSGNLRKLPGLKGVYEEAKMLGEELQAFFNAQINERKQKIDFSEDSEGTDYVEAYLRQQQKNGDDENLFS
uniref:Cytochrome P450 n=1 Tax=Panagrolaimus superbus TaxID=310955 RepID=A0A914Y4C7_9BILA